MKQIITFALAILFLLWSTSMSGQSLNDAKEFVKWKQTIAMKNHIKNTSDPCFPASSTGPFDPTECIKMQINQIASYKVYAKNNPTITRIINEEVERLLMINKSWSSLSQIKK